MLNDDYIILPYGELKRRLKWDIEYEQRPCYFENLYRSQILGSYGRENPRKSLFVRPDNVTKSFAGRVYNFDSDEDNVEALNQYQKIHDSEMCIIARPKELEAEFRHVICGQELIAQSQYRRNGVLDIRIDVDIECQRLAKHVARRENDQNWEPDYVYVVDTALTEDGPRIIEFNAFSCSGVYAADTRAIVKHVSHIAWREFNGEDIL